MQNFVIFTKKIPINVIIQTNCSLNLIKTGLQPNKKDIFIKKVILGHIYSKKYIGKYHFLGFKCALRFAGFARKGSYFIFRETTYVSYLCIHLNPFNYSNNKNIDPLKVNFW